MEVFIDLETIPTQNQQWIENIERNISPPAQMKKKETIEKWFAENSESAKKDAVAKTSFNGGVGEIFCIGFAVCDEEVEIISRDDLSIQSEREMLIKFNGKMEQLVSKNMKQPHFIGHNISGFDLRFLFHRFVIHQIKPNFLLPVNDSGWNNSFTDTMQIWSGYKDKVSLDNICKYLNVPTPKTELDGSLVWSYVQEGRWDEVHQYCKADIKALREVYNRLIFISKKEVKS